MTCRVEGGKTFIQNYNPENRLSGLSLVSGDCAANGDALKTWAYIYDGDGTKVKQQYFEIAALISTTYYFAGGSYELQTDGTTETIKQYYSIAGMTVAVRSGAEWSFFLTDHLGSVVGVTDPDGVLVSEARYTPFGELRLDVGIAITQTDFGYTFQRNLPDTGLMDYKARAYDSYLNQWTQPDTIIPDPYNPQSWNRYSYVNNNPINFNDPSGHMMTQGCGDEGKSACSPSKKELADYNYFLQRTDQLKCQSGNKLYCSSVQNHPGEAALFFTGGMALTGFAAAYVGGITITAPTVIEIGTGAETVNTACQGDCSDELGKLTNVAKNTWESTKGLIYGPKSYGSNAVLHVLDHLNNIPTKITQGVFTVNRSQVLPLIDKAWVDIQNMSPNVVAYESSMINNATGYVVEMGQTIGYIGGSTGAMLGYPSTTLLNLVLNGTTVVTAFPIAIP